MCHDVSQIGLEALTRVLAKEEPTIMVNSVDPGSCSTEYNNYQGAKSAAEGAIMASNLAFMQMEGRSRQLCEWRALHLRLRLLCTL